jgi:D-cysteine desulfhydrase
LGLGARVEGVNVDKEEDLIDKIKALAAATAAHLGLEVSFAEQDFILHNAYGKPGYGVITEAEREAIRLMARTEGIICDPVYTGRALAGLIDLTGQGVFSPDETILFWHTGGAAGLFPRATEMMGSI